MSTFAPAAAMVYSDIQTLRGLDKPVDYGSGIEYADGILDSLFPEGVGLQVRNKCILLTFKTLMVVHISVLNLFPDVILKIDWNVA